MLQHRTNYLTKGSLDCEFVQPALGDSRNYLTGELINLQLKSNFTERNRSLVQEVCGRLETNENQLLRASNPLK